MAKEYKLLTACIVDIFTDDNTEFDEHVSDHLSNGWSLYGSPQVTRVLSPNNFDREVTVMAQAVVRKKVDTEN